MKKGVEDIFSFKKTTEKKKKQHVTIIVDTREKNAMVLANLYEKQAIIETKKLEVGDYIVGEVIIERKTKTDLFNSLKSNRLKEQLKNLKQYKYKLLIVEEDNNPHTAKKEHILQNLLLSITAHHQIPIIHTETERHTAEMLIAISQKEKKESSINTQKIPKTKQERQKFIIQSFPGIGPKASHDLLEQFNSLREIFTSDKRQIEEITNEKVANDFEELLS